MREILRSVLTVWFICVMKLCARSTIFCISSGNFPILPCSSTSNAQRRLVSGVLSWCEASDTNSDFALSARFCAVISVCSPTRNCTFPCSVMGYTRRSAAYSVPSFRLFTISSVWNSSPLRIFPHISSYTLRGVSPLFEILGFLPSTSPSVCPVSGSHAGFAWTMAGSGVVPAHLRDGGVCLEEFPLWSARVSVDAKIDVGDERPVLLLAFLESPFELLLGTEGVMEQPYPNAAKNYNENVGGDEERLFPRSLLQVDDGNKNSDSKNGEIEHEDCKGEALERRRSLLWFFPCTLRH